MQAGAFGREPAAGVSGLSGKEASGRGCRVGFDLWNLVKGHYCHGSGKSWLGHPGFGRGCRAFPSLGIHACHLIVVSVPGLQVIVDVGKGVDLFRNQRIMPFCSIAAIDVVSDDCSYACGWCVPFQGNTVFLLLLRLHGPQQQTDHQP